MSKIRGDEVLEAIGKASTRGFKATQLAGRGFKVAAVGRFC